MSAEEPKIHVALPFLAGAAFCATAWGIWLLADSEIFQKMGRPDEKSRTYVVRGTSMSGIFEPWEEIEIHEGKPKKGDSVVLKTGNGRFETIVKRVLATEGDAFECRKNRCYVNGGVAANSKGIPYEMDSEMIRAYAKEYPVLPKGALFVMGNLPQWSYDSSRFGFADVSDVIGIVNN